jgi:hypothetical protein
MKFNREVMAFNDLGAIILNLYLQTFQNGGLHTSDLVAKLEPANVRP